MTVSIFDFHFVFLVFVAVEELVVFRLALCRPVVLWTMLYTIHGRNELRCGSCERLSTQCVPYFIAYNAYTSIVRT